MNDRDALIAESYVKMAIVSLKNKYPMLVYPINLLKPKATNEEYETDFVTDGEYLIFNGSKILKNYCAQSRWFLEWDILHIVLHGLLGHFTTYGKYARKKLAEVVMDREVLHLEREMCKGDEVIMKFWDPCDEDRMNTYLGNSFDMGCYYKAGKNKVLYQRMLRDGKIIRRDDHSHWLKPRTGEGGTGDAGKVRQQEIAKNWANAFAIITGNAASD